MLVARYVRLNWFITGHPAGRTAGQKQLVELGLTILSDEQRTTTLPLGVGIVLRFSLLGDLDLQSLKGSGERSCGPGLRFLSELLKRRLDGL